MGFPRLLLPRPPRNGFGGLRVPSAYFGAPPLIVPWGLRIEKTRHLLLEFCFECIIQRAAGGPFLWPGRHFGVGIWFDEYYKTGPSPFRAVSLLCWSLLHLDWPVK